ncbi:MAG: rhodanese-like domain-containing protein [Saprospiraceae bacterium]|nr:rhodanese-like domain-containing protein [Saprospiraceae bacterium]
MFNIFNFFSGGTSVDLSEVITKKSFLVDVRTPGEFAGGHIKGSINIPLDKLDANISKFKGKENIVVFCRSGNRSGQAKKILDSHGITDVVNGGAIETVMQYVK